MTAALQRVGIHVMAESDRAWDTIEMIDKFKPDLVVIDFNVAAGSGDQVVYHLRDEHPNCQAIIFTTFVTAVRPLEGPAVRIVEKHDHRGLELAVAAALQDIGRATMDQDRRRAAHDPGKAAMRDPDGIDDAVEFYRVLSEAEAGDALVGIPVVGGRSEAVAAVRKAIRENDRMILRQGVLVLLLIGAGDDGASLVLGRIAAGDPGLAAGAKVRELDGEVDPNDALREVATPS